ncbi:SGNH hydrolase domain-containing protein, partial [Rhizobiaceae sp. 2RAB30]
MSAFFIASNGFGGYAFSPAYAERLHEAGESLKPAYQFPYVCQRYQVSAADLTDRNCVINGSGEEEPKILLWGDSNAAHYVALLGELAKQQG